MHPLLTHTHTHTHTPHTHTHAHLMHTHTHTHIQGLEMVVCYSQDGRTIPDHIPDECDMVFVCEQFDGQVYEYLHSRKFRYAIFNIESSH